MKELIEKGKTCKHDILTHVLGYHKEDHVRHIVHLAIASAALSIAITTLCKSEL